MKYVTQSDRLKKELREAKQRLSVWLSYRKNTTKRGRRDANHRIKNWIEEIRYINESIEQNNRSEENMRLFYQSKQVLAQTVKENESNPTVTLAILQDLGIELTETN